MDEPFADILNAASQAPSGDNTQPWRFVIDRDAGTIALELDETRDTSPMNAGQRMARVAVGAALENLLRRTVSLGWAAELNRGVGRSLAVVRLTGKAPDQGPKEDKDVIASRVTNRQVYDGRPVPPESLDRLARETPDRDGVSTHWIVGAERLKALARLIGRADAVMFGNISMLRAFLSQVRLDVSPGLPVAEGLCSGSLTCSPADRLALRLMNRAPDRWLAIAGVSRVFASKARQLVRSSSGLCLVVARKDDDASDLLVGRAMQRAWLALTTENLAAQPMMSLPVLENAIENGPSALRAELGPERIANLSDEFRKLVPEIGPGRLAFLMRFGFAPAPGARTGRLSLASISTNALS